MAQNSRILRDFPWLWALRGTWYPGFMDVVMLNGYGNIHLELFLRGNTDNEVWVRYGSYSAKDDGTDCLTVKEIKRNPEWGAINWAVITRWMVGSHEILNIILIIPPKEKCPEKFVIYRIKKKDRYNFRMKMKELQQGFRESH